MKKLASILLLLLFLAGCSGGMESILGLIASPTPTPQDTNTPQPTVTLFPTQDLFLTSTSTPVTFTPTSTPIIPDQLNTSTPRPSVTAPPPSTQSVAFFTPKNDGFLAILTSNYVIYWNSGSCTPRTLTVTVFVEDIIHTDKVVLYLRPREKSDTTLLGNWSNMEMLPNENGSFSYDVTAVNVKQYIWFRDAWLEYQIVSFDEDFVEVARSQIYDRSMSLVMCRTLGP